MLPAVLMLQHMALDGACAATSNSSSNTTTTAVSMLPVEEP
jgi:hypothetical protein